MTSVKAKSVDFSRQWFNPDKTMNGLGKSLYPPSFWDQPETAPIFRSVIISFVDECPEVSPANKVELVIDPSKLKLNQNKIGARKTESLSMPVPDEGAPLPPVQLGAQ